MSKIRRKEGLELRKNLPGYLLMAPAVIAVLALSVYTLFRGIYLSFLNYNLVLLSGSGELPALPGGTAGLLVRLRPRRTLLPHHPVPHAGAEASGGDPVDRRL